MFTNRVTIVVGHFGSGTTEIALHVALRLAGTGVTVALVDLDVVKPYFRSRSARDFLTEKGVGVIAPEGELAHADLPIVMPAVRRALQDPAARVVLDVGGDPIGTRALGSVSDVIPVAETDHLLVLNFRRPYTETEDDAVVMARATEAAARIPLTGLISNTHLLGETTPEIVVEGYERAREVGSRLGLPVVAVGADEATRPLLDESTLGCLVLELTRLIRPPFEQSRFRPRVGPLFALN
ncbi:MAG: hypothetical protein HY825_06655 [Acidobacteria bacterium]|nr:hypothetical protein [Acidobacteriota bacterium]